MVIKKFTHPYRELICCDSVSLWTIRSNVSAALHSFGPNFFLRSFGQKNMSQNSCVGKGPVGPGPGAKKQ